MHKCDFSNQDVALEYIKNLRNRLLDCVEIMDNWLEDAKSLVSYLEDDNTKKTLDEIKVFSEDLKVFDDIVLNKYEWYFTERICIDD